MAEEECNGSRFAGQSKQKTERRSGIKSLETRLLMAAQLVKDINTLPGDFGLGDFGPASSVVYFAGHDGADGMEVWRTNGTVAGTQMVKDIWPGLGSSIPDRFTPAGAVTYFTADDGVSGYELWRTDGTAGGTSMVKDINPGNAASSPTDLVVSGSTVFFFADDGSHGRELWRSTGTDVGTQMVIDLRPGPLGQGTVASKSRMAVATDGTLYIIATDGGIAGLYKSNGTVGNITQVYVPNSLFFAGNPSPITSVNRVYFTDASGYVWTSDGTAAGTTPIDSVNSSASPFINVSGRIFYSRGTQMKAISGTTVSTITGAYTIPSGGYFETNPAHPTNVSGTVYFIASGASGAGLWKIASGGCRRRQ